MKLELKHLAPYLPYSLEVIHSEVNKAMPVTPLVLQGILDHQDKPLLRPLSDLTNYVEELEQFCPHTDDERYNDDGEDGFEINLQSFANLDTRLRLNWFCYEFYQKLFELHFDVFGLIEAGLAIKK